MSIANKLINAKKEVERILTFFPGTTYSDLTDQVQITISCSASLAGKALTELKVSGHVYAIGKNSKDKRYFYTTDPGAHSSDLTPVVQVHTKAAHCPPVRVERVCPWLG